MYDYKGLELNRPIAEELILELFAGKKNVKKAKIKDTVLQEHSKRGGIDYTRQTTPVTDALKNLRDKGLATNKKRGYWTFKAKETTKGNERDKALDDAFKFAFLIQAGLNDIGLGDYAGAIKKFDEALEIIPNSTQALQGRALCKSLLCITSRQLTREQLRKYAREAVSDMEYAIFVGIGV